MAKWTTDKDSITLDSSSFVGSNSSYSGSDIKVLVHTYDPNEASKIIRKIKDQDLRKLEKEENEIKGQIESTISKIVDAHPNTPEEERLKRTLVRLQKKKEDIDNAWVATAVEENPKNDDTPIGAVKVLSELQTISISTYRDKREVRALGHVYSKGVVRGPRTISGSMVFTVFNKHVLEEIMRSHSSDFDSYSYTSAVPDQIPPLDVTIIFANELGKVSRMSIYGVEFVNEGMVMSIENILTESTMSFIARDFDPMRSVAERKIDESYKLQGEWTNRSASDLIFEEDYWNKKSILDPFERFHRRNNPFI